MTTLRYLSVLDLRENKVAMDAKYREQVIMTGRQIKELDGKTVREQDRRYLVALASRKSLGYRSHS